MNSQLNDVNQNVSDHLSTLQNQLQDLLTQIRSQTGAPGIALALSLGGQHIHASTGYLTLADQLPLTIDAKFQLGCITKLLTCVVAATLIDDGILDKEMSIDHYLPELANTQKGREICVWHLMSHTSGYQEVDVLSPAMAYNLKFNQLVDYLINAKQLFKPGSVFSYSHTEHVLLGEIIQRLTGKPIIQLFRERIFEPLMLSPGTIRGDQATPNINIVDHVYDLSTSTVKPLKPLPFGDGWKASLSDLTMTLSDLVRFAEAIVGFNQPDTPASNAPTRAAMDFVQKQVTKLPNTIGGIHREQMPAAFGVGCAAYRGWLLGHNGSARGQTCGLRFDPRNKIALAVGINAWIPFLRDKIINHIFGLLRGQPIAAAPQEPLEFKIEQLAGTYVGPQGPEFVLLNREDELRCTLTTKKPLEIVFKQDSQGLLHLKSDVQHHSLGFFKDPDNGVPCIMWGATAYTKQPALMN